MTSNYNLPSDIPYTTAESDFQRLISTTITDDQKKALIEYSSTDFASLRESMLTYLRAAYAEDYQNIAESDFAVMFTELIAYMGSILSFKADALANENFLPTARNRRNVKKLLELIGIRMKGPTSAGASAQLTLGSAITDAIEQVLIDASDRSFTVTSPLDGAALTYTLYKLQNGKIANLNSNSTDIELLPSEVSNDASTVWTNLALLEGALVEETGFFDNTEIFKTISLTQGPVIENSVQVFVNSAEPLSGTYHQVDNIFSASGSTNQIFELLYDDIYNGTIRFGDGRVGASPPNSSTYKVLYRVGGGSRGNLLGTTIDAPISTSQGAGTVTNTSVATGGMDAETIQEAKATGPLVFKQQDRLVTLEDYSSYVSRYRSPNGGAAIGTATTRKAYSSANIVDVYVLQKATNLQLQKATIDYKSNLLQAMSQKKMLTDELVIVDGLIRTLDLVSTLYVDISLLDYEETIKAEAIQVIQNFFSYTSFQFGTRFVPEELNRDLFNLNKIRYSTIDNFDSAITPDFNEVIQLNNITINISYI
tara:strand:+ start:16902 stop:18515 length:1614 start_codon:yes stop_codon:yes gene_type:complete